jgi:geranylgeranyl pyrophosphate synthase
VNEGSTRRAPIAQKAAESDSGLPSVPVAFEELLNAWRERMETGLATRLPAADVVPTRLHEAMRYSVLGGGKRIRSALVFATALTVGLTEDEVEGAACAIELVHAYSLVHDDLPAMDDDDLRRGRPTCHKAFDEATAVLVGDALQPLAFQLLARDSSLPSAAAVRLRLIDLLAEASGTFGMAGGQAIDLAASGRMLDISQVEDMHARKTGAIIRASVLMAAECALNLDRQLYAALDRYATAIGLAFQIQDDLLDITSDVATMGKPVRADSERAQPTHPAMIGIVASQERMHRLHLQALDALSGFGDKAWPLRLLAQWLLSRRH